MDYSNSRPLYVHKWSEYSEVNRFIDEIFKHLSSFNGNTKITKKLLKVLLLDLYMEAYKKNDCATALNQWTTLAKNNHTKANHDRLLLTFKNGNGVP